nr:hypothetical protein CFP56_00784 [Quercus suber]
MLRFLPRRMMMTIQPHGRTWSGRDSDQRVVVISIEFARWGDAALAAKRLQDPVHAPGGDGETIDSGTTRRRAGHLPRDVMDSATCSSVAGLLFRRSRGPARTPPLDARGSQTRL